MCYFGQVAPLLQVCLSMEGLSWLYLAKVVLAVIVVYGIVLCIDRITRRP